MKIALATDHKGFEFKEVLKQYLLENAHEVEDYGALQLTPADDYPDYAIPAVQSVTDKKNERAILLCNNGLGMSIVANRFKGIKGTLVYSEKSAKESRTDNDSNVLCLGTEEFTKEQLISFVNIWLTTGFDGDRHARRLEKIDKIN